MAIRAATSTLSSEILSYRADLISTKAYLNTAQGCCDSTQPSHSYHWQPQKLLHRPSSYHQGLASSTLSNHCYEAGWKRSSKPFTGWVWTRTLNDEACLRGWLQTNFNLARMLINRDHCSNTLGNCLKWLSGIIMVLETDPQGTGKCGGLITCN